MSGRHVQWIEIDVGALRHNLRLFRRLLTPGTRLAAVVKANAYGHGLDAVAPVAAREADVLAVHSAGEARRLRALGVGSPVLVMGFVPRHEMEGLDAGVHLLVSTEESVRWAGEHARATGVRLPLHLKIETGTHRQGVSPERAVELARLAASEGLEVVGAATHFANIEDTLEHDFAQEQLARFREAVARLERELGKPLPYVHAACSAAALLFREADFTMARVGIAMYGHWPSRETHLSWVLDHGRDGVRLQPVLSWKAVVGQVQEVPAGATVGYGRTWRALRPTRLAVIPVGYADGYPRVLGNRARVLVRGVAVPVVGRVCMNILMADVTDVPGVAVGDEVVLIGRQGEAEVTAEDLAQLSGTIAYEILARLSPGIPRIVIPDGGAVSS